jgi:hypothetical protein
MPLWKNTDDAANSTIYAAAQVKLTPNTTNQTNLFGNTTADAFITGSTVGQFGVTVDEVAANRNIPHAGWVLRTEGSGGRAGRVQYETLVAMSSITGDAADDTKFPDYAIVISTQPTNKTAYSSNNQIATFTVVAATVPTGGTVTYQWQKWGGAAFANVTNTGAYSNTTTATLSVLANTASNGEIYRAVLSASGANTSVNSSNAVITIVA